MQNPICLSTGCLYGLYEDRNEMIEVLREFSPDGIEISFIEAKYLLNFNISKTNLKYLKTLKFNSIHAPAIDIVYDYYQASREIFQKISELYKKINAHNVVFHKRCIKDYDLVLKNDFVSSVENEDWRIPGHKIDDMKNVLDENKGFKFTFDFAHALTVSSADIEEYINYFKEKIIQIHISIYNKELLKHDFLHKYHNKETRKLLQYLKSVSVPLVLESTASNQKEIQLIKKDIEYIKNL